MNTKFKSVVAALAAGLITVGTIGVLSACGGKTKQHEHTYVEHAAVSATCETPGYEAYFSCQGCNKYFDTDKKAIARVPVIPVVEHGIANTEFVPTQRSTTNPNVIIKSHYECGHCGAKFNAEFEFRPITDEELEMAWEGLISDGYKNGIWTKCVEKKREIFDKDTGELLASSADTDNPITEPTKQYDYEFVFWADGYYSGDGKDADYPSWAPEGAKEAYSYNNDNKNNNYFWVEENGKYVVYVRRVSSNQIETYCTFTIDDEGYLVVTVKHDTNHEGKLQSEVETYRYAKNGGDRI